MYFKRQFKKQLNNKAVRISLRRTLSVLLCVLLAVFFVLPHRVLAEEEDKSNGRETVRVGWYESKFHRMDETGRRSGYGYEYQRKVAAYTGWNYEYVEGTWPELLEMLKNGEIDMLSDVSYTEERSKYIGYSSLPMGTESYYVFISPKNKEIQADDPQTLTGKKVGVDRGSIMVEMFRDWAKMRGVEVELTELSVDQDVALQMLTDGDMDAYVMLDSFGDAKVTKPVWKIGSSDFYFGVSMAKPQLLKELDEAMSKIQDENIYYNQQLYEKYLRDSGNNIYLSPDELQWLSEHGGKIRVAYQDNYLAFCAKDPDTGELTGALRDALAYASTCMENAEIEFEPICYSTAAEALEAVKSGEADCMFPSNLTVYDGEQMGVVMTPALMTTEMDAVVKESAQKEFLKKKDVVVAVNRGNTNYETFLKDHYPGWKIEYFDDTPAGLEGVEAGKADCVIISNYRYNNISKQCENLHLTTVYTGVDMDCCFAVGEGNGALYSILSKTTDVIPQAAINSALTYYSTEDVKTGFFEFLFEHLPLILLVIAVIILVIMGLLIRSIRMEKIASKEHMKVKELDSKVYVDSLTNVKNKGAFTEYTQRLQKRLDKTGSFDFAIGMFDCDNLKRVNDVYGHDKGDVYLKGASRLLCHVFRHSPVFRLGGDEFAVILEDEDFRSMEGLVKSFYRRRKELCALAENEWDEVHISMGIAVYDPETDQTVEDTIRRADQTMYENKRIGKKNRNNE